MNNLIKQFIKEVIIAGDDGSKSGMDIAEPSVSPAPTTTEEENSCRTHLREGDVEFLEANYPPELKKSLETVPLNFKLFSPEQKKKSLEDIIGNARKSLGKELGRGSSRIVFAAGPDKVMKIALNPAGVAQNKAEVDVYDKGGRDPDAPITQVFTYDDHYRWIESEKATTKNVSDVYPELDQAFEDATGYGYRKIMSFLVYGMPSYPPSKKALQQNRKAMHFLNQFLKLERKLGLDPKDFPDASQWGIVKRNGQSFPILVDYGYTEEIGEKYYGVTGDNKYWERN